MFSVCCSEQKCIVAVVACGFELFCRIDIGLAGYLSSSNIVRSVAALVQTCGAESKQTHQLTISVDCFYGRRNLAKN